MNKTLAQLIRLALFLILLFNLFSCEDADSSKEEVESLNIEMSISKGKSGIEDSIESVSITKKHEDSISNISNSKQSFETVKFGKYYIDNPYNKDDLDWYVINYDTINDKALLITKDIIEVKSLHDYVFEENWNDFSLFSANFWLKNTFIEETFTKEEKEKLTLCYVENKNYGVNSSTDSSEISGKVLILSSDEIQKLFPDPRDRVSNPTKYVISSLSNSFIRSLFLKLLNN